MYIPSLPFEPLLPRLRLQPRDTTQGGICRQTAARRQRGFLRNTPEKEGRGSSRGLRSSTFVVAEAGGGMLAIGSWLHSQGRPRREENARPISSLKDGSIKRRCRMGCRWYNVCNKVELTKDGLTGKPFFVVDHGPGGRVHHFKNTTTEAYCDRHMESRNTRKKSTGASCNNVFAFSLPIPSTQVAPEQPPPPKCSRDNGRVRAPESTRTRLENGIKDKKGPRTGARGTPQQLAPLTCTNAAAARPAKAHQFAYTAPGSGNHLMPGTGEISSFSFRCVPDDPQLSLCSTYEAMSKIDLGWVGQRSGDEVVCG
ncbi:hypothetical protein LX32DRAFT_170112 [Colletotrichum zoysiae]|uniref:Uncharacterized protein n=1 Tax=Colletotrichum zoysiae TaxID=1216348 RepID=A0AAD9HP79_9PEZI|nr:hypothetical protein LX32DRAFT_170112 [Colletotrichum zoysiae]